MEFTQCWKRSENMLNHFPKNNLFNNFRNEKEKKFNEIFII